jgi:hypothetical protein
MVWANRAEPAPPTVRFDQIDGWTIQTENSAEATLQITRAQNVWNRPVARLRYRGDGKAETKPRITLRPPEPIGVPDNSDSVDMWAYGNRWDWEHPPGTPPVGIVLHLRDGAGKAEDLHVDSVRWQEWWLMHRKLPGSLKSPVRMVSLEISGGWQSEWREIFFDSIRFSHEELRPIEFKARPRRNLAPVEGQSAGANTGPGWLPFPTTEKTILPMDFSGRHSNGITHMGSHRWSFDYRSHNGSVAYFFDPGQGLSSIEAYVDDELVGRLLDGAAVHLEGSGTNLTLLSVNEQGHVVSAEYSDGTRLRLQIWQKSLVIDVINTNRHASELSFGRIAGVKGPRIIGVPYLTYGGGPRPCVLLSQTGTKSVFSSIWLDWYRSNGSEPYAADSVTADTAQINGGVRYQPRTDGVRNAMFERIFVTVSPRFEEALPSVPNPIG